MTDKSFHKKLVERFWANKASEKELEVFFHLLKQGELDNILSESMRAKAESGLLEREAIIKETTLVRLPFWRRRSVAAASILIVAAVISWLIYGNSMEQPKMVAGRTDTNTVLHDAAPGANKAVLTLTNGETIVLDSATNGALTSQGSVRILNKDGHLVYEKIKNQEAEVVYNKMETLRGGQYQLTLADGSKVWLNAASSIRFPNIFKGNERVVEITGEAYFEVAKNAVMPFRVKIKKDAGHAGEIEVLGTHFNVNAYANETVIKSTLLEGSIKIKSIMADAAPVSPVIIKPGEEAQLGKRGSINVKENVDVEEAVAWKNGMFYFNRASIESIMRQVERWYDLEVVFIGNKPSGEYHGEISRNVPASEMLKILQTAGVQFNIENKKLTVMPDSN